MNWGCIGTGAIAHAMSEQLSMLPEANLFAICSATGRSVDASQLFGFQRVVENYEALVKIPEIDIVYVASANTDHAKHSLAALRAGKHVLCEKPVAMNMHELVEMQTTAKLYKRLFMDGTFQAYLPSFRTLSNLLTLRGPPLTIHLNKKIKYKIMHESPLLTSSQLGGGIYEGTGSYTAHMLVAIMGVNVVMALRHERITVSSIKGPGGVDWQTMVNIEFPSGTMAVLSHVAYNDTTLSKVTSHSGGVEFNLPKISRITTEGVPIELECDGVGKHPGLGSEAQHAMDLLATGTLESPLLTYDTSRAIVHLMDLVRSKIRSHPHYIMTDEIADI